MKVSAVSNYNTYSGYNAGRSANTLNKAKNNPSFTGVADFLVGFWQNVETGGRVVQFVVEDMCGTGIPRMSKSATAGYKYTHKINYAALVQSALRDLLTGPVMCAMPFAILGAAKKYMGKTSDTHIENIKNLSYIMSALENTPKETLDKDFIQAVVVDMLKKSTGKEELNPADTEQMISKILSYKELLAQTKPEKSEVKKASSDISKFFEGIVKRTKDSYKDTDFQLAKYSISAEKTGATKVGNYVDYAINYVDDFTKEALKGDNDKVTKKAIDAFKNSWSAKRLGLIVAMIGLTGFAMSFIPKIYTKASGKVNPNAKSIYSQAQKLPDDRKGDNV